MIHRKISYKLLFTEKYDTKSPLSSIEGYSPSITTVVPGKKSFYNVAMSLAGCTCGKKVKYS